MAIFHYKAIDRTGQAVQGQIEAGSSAEASGRLAEQGRFVNEIVGGGARGEYSVAASVKKVSRKIRLSKRDRCDFIRQLATALEGKLPILTALEVVGQQNPRVKVKQLTKELSDSIRSGESLSFALSQYPGSFDRLHISLVSVGEAAGNIDRSMVQLAELSEREMETRNGILTAALYPGFVLCLGLLSVAIVVTVILPNILSTLIMDASVLPWPTRAILALSDFLRSRNGMIGVCGFIFVLILFFRWKRTVLGRFFWDNVKLKMPVLGVVLGKWAVSRFARTLGTLTAGGINILDALRIVRDCMGNEVLAREVDRAAVHVRGGSSLAGVLRDSGRFPPLLVQIVSVGEETGQMSEMLLNASDAFDRDTDMAVKRFMALFPAVLILILALVIGFIVAATLLPIVEIETAMPGF